MNRSICRFILYRLMKWKTDITLSLPEKYIIALAPHTSNWDFILGILYSRAEKIKCQFLIKDFWFFWPLGILMRKLGGIPVHREKSHHLTDQIANIAKNCKDFGLCITPEGTRKATTEWKKGFYYIAQKANLPIFLYGIDYKEKCIVCTQSLMPTNNFEEDINKIKKYFSQFTGKKEQNFQV